MGQLHDREVWAERLKSPGLVAALEAWVKRKPFDLHQRGWFADGRSRRPVARVLHASPDDTDQFVLKFFDDSDEKRAANIQQAWLNAHEEFRKHLAEVKEDTIMLGDWSAVFLCIAGGNLNALQPLTDLYAKSELAEYCGTVTASVSRTWNRNRFPRETRLLSDVLKEIMDRRYDAAFDWARRSGVPLGIAPAVCDATAGQTHCRTHSPCSRAPTRW
ncbi:hypothetical protein [Actinophytocola sp.]|uniref:hypothetical protein n=1 Tax=Actinophytocola sp. TaxID=1872138 RepID=UPI00389A4919